MSNYELYNKVLEAVDKDEGTFNAAARNWVEGAADVYFEDGEANDLFYTAKMACAAWRNKAINGRVSKLRMINCVRKITEKKLPNPYQKEESHYIKEIENAMSDKAEEKVAEKKEEVHIFGVVEEEKEDKRIFKRKR